MGTAAERETGEIVSVDTQATTEDRGMRIYAEAEQRARLINELVPSLLKACHSGDITDHGGKPFVGDSGCEKIARVSGISFSSPEVTREYVEDEKGGRVFRVFIRGQASILGQTIEEVGGCDATDKFIASRRSSPTQIPLEVEKKAYCNWRGRCVRTLLGMNGLRWEDLKKHGITPDGRTKIEYKEGSKSHADGGKAEAAEAEADDVRQKIREQILKNLDGNEDDAKEALRRITEFTDDKGKVVPGRESVLQLSEKWAFKLWSEIKPGGKHREKYENIIMEIVSSRKEKAGAK